MKIALFTDTYPPRINGVATSVHVLRKNLEAMGHETLIVTSRDPNATDSEPGIIRIPSIPFKTERLATIAPPWVYVNIGMFNPEIIHTHAEFSLGILGRTMAMIMKRPHVHTMHTVWEYYTKHLIDIDVIEPAIREAARKYTALVCNQADKVIVPTAKVEELLRSYKVRKDIVIIPTGIDVDRFDSKNATKKQLHEIREELGIAAGDRVLINICRIEKEKNLDELMISLKDYLLSHPNVKLVFVGDGTAKAELEKFAGELGLGDKVIFAGKRPQNEINRYYRIGDIFISASISETQGLTYVEAMASELPVVAKRDRCLENVLREGENGFMFDDAAGLVSAVEKLLGDEEMRRRFSSRAAATAQKFSSKAYADNVLALYEEISVKDV